MKHRTIHTKSWWRVPLMLLMCLIGGSSPTWADTWHFSGNSEHAVVNHPTLASPYMQFVGMFFDKTSGNNGYFTKTKPTSYVSKIPSSAADGPAMFINGEYLCSPIDEFGWNGDGDGAWSACGNDTWWKNTYTRKINGITYTVKFYNPYHVGSTKRMMVNVFIFADKWVAGTKYNVTIAGMFKMNSAQKTPVEESYTWAFNALPSLGISSPTAEPVNYTKIKISGKLLSAYGPTTVGSYKGATTSGLAWSDNLTSSKEYDPGTSLFSNQEIDFSERSDYYNTASKYIEYIVAFNNYSPSGFDAMSPKANMKYYQWYISNVPGYIRAKANPTAVVNNKWSKEVKLTWSSEGNNTGGTWSIYRYKSSANPSTRELVKENLGYSTTSYTTSAPTYDENYTFEVAFIPQGGVRRNELTRTASVIMKRDWNIKIDSVKVFDDSKLKVNWSHNSIEDATSSKAYQLVLQRSENKTSWTDVKTISITSTNTVDGEYTDASGLTANRTYYYRLKITVMDKEYTTDPVGTKLGGSKILGFSATRGSYSNMVKLQWQVKQVGTNLTNFIIQRRPLGSNDDSAWADIYTTSGTASAYSYDDVTALPGSFNEYKVVVWSQDGNVRTTDDEMNTDGFSLTTGMISGNITFGTGTAVDSVKVTLKQQTADGDITSGMRSVRLSGAGSGMKYSCDSTTIRKLLNGDFSIQMFLNPNNMVMSKNNQRYLALDVANAFTLGIRYDSSKQAYQLGAFVSNDKWSSLYIPANEWTQVTCVRNSVEKNVTFYIVDGDSLLSSTIHQGDTINWSDTFPYPNKNNYADCIAIGNSGPFNYDYYFDGYIDEFRFFTRALTEGDILRNYNHPLAGNETGLAIYYPFDEGLSVQNLAYDFSKTNGVSNGRHATAKVSAASSTYIPSEDQMSLMAYTDVNGYYEVRGVPFSGEGTSYSIIPTLGIHEFSPTTRSRFVSMSTLNHSGVDFEDVSSFPVSGKVFYAGTDYPVEGVYFTVDGTPCAKDGKQITSAEDGSFTISVPIGEHFISVEKQGHVFADNGRYPADPNGVGVRLNFNHEIKNLDFHDETLVNFTGRIVGGSIEGDKPIGFGKSQNNIGITQLVLTTTKPEVRMNVKRVESGTTYSYKTNDSTVTVASASSKINSRSWRGAGTDECRNIYIQTDSLTGEFSAMVPPILYETSTMNVLATGVKVGEKKTIDLTQPLVSYKDSTENASGGYDYYTYNTLLKQTYHSTPSFTVAQRGNDSGAFGIKKYKVEDALGTIDIDDIYTVDPTTGVSYKYGAAMFESESQYIFDLKGFEAYANYDADKDHPEVQTVPLAGVVVTIANALSSEQGVYIEGNADGAEPGSIANLQTGELELDSLGQASYVWKAGLPNISAPYTRTISISYAVEDKIEQWEAGPLTGIVLGALPTGNNFLTEGPDLIDMILRDPPGSGSSAEWSSGTTTSYSHSRGGVWSSETGIQTTSKLGVDAKTVTGIGVAKLDDLESRLDLKIGVQVNVEGEDASSWGRSVTTTRTISTSDDADYVGADGDIYIGSSTNIIYGLARNVGLTRVGESQDVELTLKDVMTTGLSFDTEFAYTQNYIENVLLPNYLKTRDDLLITMSDTTGFVNTTDKAVFITQLSPDDERYGTSNNDSTVWGNQATAFPSSAGPSYRMVIPQGSKESFQDMVEWCNNQMKNWRKHLYANEMEKVKAWEQAQKNREDSIKVLNVSFDAGSSVTYSTEMENTRGTSYDCTVTSIATVGFESGCAINSTGVYWDVTTETGGGEHFADEEETAETASFSYTFAEEGSDALSVDVYEYGKYSPIFRTRGGQTSAPHEGEVVTQYYEPGTVIMEGTMQIEVPEIAVDQSTMSDIPTGGFAAYTLRLSNASEIGEDVAYRLFFLDETNPDGAELSIDGKVLTAEGRLIKVPGNQTLTKTLQLRQTDIGILQYDSIAIVFASDSQPEEIADTVYITAQFVPSSSEVQLALSNTLMNTQTGTNLEMTFSGFDRNYRGLKAFRLQYKRQGSADWTQLYEYVTDSTAVTQNNQLLPKTGASVSYMLPMASFSDGSYLFRVASVATYGTGEVYRYSDEIALTKDMARPRPLGQPEPADGVLDIGDELSITFNEAFLKGELTTEQNFRVTGVLNGAAIDHETALSMQGSETTAQTEADIALAGKPFSFDAWVNLSGQGTILSHGAGSQKFTVSTDAMNHLVVTVADSTLTSSNVVPTGKWAFLSLSYLPTETGGDLSAKVAVDALETDLFLGEHTVAYEGNGPLTVGKNLTGAIHELLLWDEAHDMTTALLNRSVTKNPSTRHLIGYWKMNEGEGKQIRDYARSRHLTMPQATWYINNVNKAVTLDGASCLSTLTADLNIFSGDDYAVEFWMRGDAQTGEAQLLQMGDVGLWLNTSGTLMLTGKGAYLPIAEQTSNVSTQASNLLDNVWHHVALNVLRQGAAAVYVDGQRVLSTNATNVGSITSSNLFIGAKRTTVFAELNEYNFERGFKGQVDEVRIWSATKTADQLSANSRVRLTGSEDGLALYFPFEKKQLDSGNQVETVGNADDLAGSGHTAQLLAFSGSPAEMPYTDQAPALRTKPTEANVSFTFTASDNKIVIELDENAAAIDGTTLNFTVRDLRDENGNYSEPATWSAFINKKELLWQDDVISTETAATTAATMTATIVNKSGTQQMWTLSGMPSWLQASTEYGTTNPASQTQVTFTVSPSTPIGKYEETIYLKSNNGIETPLTVQVRITGDEPLWAVNVGDYDETMNIIATLDILGTLSEDEDDVIGAFIGDVCRGVTKMEYKARYDSYFLTMDIYGKGSDDGEPIEFKVFDASTGIIYPVVKVSDASQAPVNVTFEANNLLGLYATPYRLSATDEIEQNIDLGKGWNWMSLSVKPDNFSVSNAFAKAGGKVSYLKDGTGGVAEFDGTDWFSEITEMNNREMYAVQTNDNLTLSVIGHKVKPAEEPITVKDGWTWVAFNSMSVMSLEEALADMQPQGGEIIKGQRGVAYYDSYEWSGSLRQLSPGLGYKIQGRQARTFTYPTTTVSAGSRRAQAPLRPETTAQVFTPVDYHLYPANMVVIAQVVSAGEPQVGAEVGIFAGDECREAAVTDSRGMVYVTVPGDKPVELSFVIAKDGRPLKAAETVGYETDAVCGTPRQPLLIDLATATAIGQLSNSNLSDSKCFDLQGRRVNSQMLNSAGRQMKGVYIVNGQKKVK